MKYGILLATLFCSLSGFASEFGAGIILGNPSGLTGKIWQDQKTAYDFGISFSVSNYILVYGDYLFHYPGSIKEKGKFFSQLSPYWGIGGVFVVTNSDRGNDDKYLGRKSGSFGAGVRIPFGLEWKPTDPPLGVFLEIVPGLSVAPSTDAMVMGGLGVRYYF